MADDAERPLCTPFPLWCAWFWLLVVSAIGWSIALWYFYLAGIAPDGPRDPREIFAPGVFLSIVGFAAAFISFVIGMPFAARIGYQYTKKVKAWRRMNATALAIYVAHFVALAVVFVTG